MIFFVQTSGDMVSVVFHTTAPPSTILNSLDIWDLLTNDTFPPRLH